MRAGHALIAACCGALWLSACGGGGSSSQLPADGSADGSVAPVDSALIDSALPPDGGVAPADSAPADSAPIDSNAPAMAQITVHRTGAGTGTVSSQGHALACAGDCTLTVDVGTSVTLVATADPDAVFSGWSGGGCSGATPTCTIVVNRDVATTAQFDLAVKSLQIDKTGAGGGTVTSIPGGIACGTDCTEAYAAVTVVTLAAIPAADSVFVGWSGGGCSGTGACVVTVDRAIAVTAGFALVPFNLRVERAGNGGGSIVSSPAGIACGTDCAESYDAHTVVTLTATPVDDSVFTGWSASGCAGTGPCTVTVDQTFTVTGSFALKRFALTVDKTGNAVGTVTSSPPGIACGTSCTTATANYDAHTVVTLTATPGSRALFGGWSGACSGTATTCTVSVEQAVSVAANFVFQQFPVTVSKAGTGSGTVTSAPAGISCGTTCTASFDSGSFVTLIPTPNDDSTFSSWSSPFCNQAQCSLQVSDVTSVTATFTLKQFLLQVTKTGTSDGIVTSDVPGINCGNTCSHNYAAHTVVTLTANPNGAVFKGWTGGGCSGTGTCVVTTDQAATVSARFDLPQFPLVIFRAGPGSGEVTSTPAGISCPFTTCFASFLQGTLVTLTAAPDGGADFAGWSGGGCTGAGVCRVTMEEATTVTATFTLKQFLLGVNLQGSGSGRVTSDVGGIDCGSNCLASLPAHTVITLTAHPAAGSLFHGWGRPCEGTDTCVITLESDLTDLVATFNLPSFTVAVLRPGDGSGTVRSSPSGITCGNGCLADFPLGTSVTLTATAGTNSAFTGWSGACSGTAACVVSSGVIGTVFVSAIFSHERIVASNFQSPSNLVMFPIEAAGNAVAQVISGSNTTMVNVRSVVVADGEIFAIDQTANAIVVFPTTASGNVAPIRRIAGPDTGLGTGLVLNAAVFGGEIYVPQTDGTISVFPQNADGDVAPTRVISGLGFITYLAISSGEIYVTGDHQIEVLPVDASGPVAPTRVIMGAATGLNLPTALLVTNDNLFVSDSAPGAIRVYARTASGNAAPLRVLTGAATRLVRPWQLGMYNGDLYVVDDSVAGISPPSAILVFAATATGNTAPKRMINGPLTSLVSALGLFLYP
jgi:hypothetical protein